TNESREIDRNPGAFFRRRRRSDRRIGGRKRRDLPENRQSVGNSGAHPKSFSQVRSDAGRPKPRRRSSRRERPRPRGDAEESAGRLRGKGKVSLEKRRQIPQDRFS